MPRATARSGDTLFVRGGFGGQYRGLAVVDGGSGKAELNLPPGIPAPDWSTFYVVVRENGVTAVRAYDPFASPDTPPEREQKVIGDYQLPGTGLSDVSGGLSPDGHWLVLSGMPSQEQSGNFSRNGGLSDQFVVMDTALAGGARGLILHDRYRFLAISNDGQFLYLLGFAGGQGRGSSQVHVYDLQKSQLLSQPLVDSTGVTVTFGFNLSSLPSADGQWLYSLDGGNGGPVLYALNLNSRQVQRLALPLVGDSLSFAAQARALLTGSADGKSLYVVNSFAGSIIEVDTASFTVRRTHALPLRGSATVRPTPDSASPFRGDAVRGNGGFRFGFRAAVLSPDGGTLYVSGDTGVAAIDISDLSLTGLYLAGIPIESLAFSGDGARLYAMSGEQGKIVKLNPQTGATEGELADLGQQAASLHVVTNP